MMAGLFVPTNVVATAGNQQVTLTWTPPSSTGGYPITDYSIEVSPDSLPVYLISTGSTASTYVVTGLTNGTSYTFRVKVITGSGMVSLVGSPVYWQLNTFTPKPVGMYNVQNGPLSIYNNGSFNGVALSTSKGLAFYNLAAPMSPVNTGYWLAETDYGAPDYDGQQNTGVQATSDGSRFLTNVLLRNSLTQGYPTLGQEQGTNTGMISKGLIAGGGFGAINSDIYKKGSDWFFFSETGSGVNISKITTFGASATTIVDTAEELSTSIYPWGTEYFYSQNIKAVNDYLCLGLSHLQSIADPVTSQNLMVIDISGMSTTHPYSTGITSSDVYVYNAASFTTTGERPYWCGAIEGDPIDSTVVFFLVSFVNSNYKLTRFKLIKFKAGAFSIVGEYVPPSPWVGLGAFQLMGVPMEMFQFNNDTVVFIGLNNNYPNDGTNKINVATTTVAAWGSFQENIISIPNNDQLKKIYFMKAFTDGSSIFLTTVGSGFSTGDINTWQFSYSGGSSGDWSNLSNAVTPSGGTSTTVPSIVTSLTASAGDGMVTLGWSAPTTGAPIVSYEVKNISIGVTQTVTPTTYTFTGLTNGITYTFSVAATNVVGTGPVTTISKAPITGVSVPGMPQNSMVVVTGTNATISWTPPASSGGLPVTGYTINLYLATGGSPTTRIVLWSVRNYTFSNLLDETRYYITVTANNDVGIGPATPALYFTTSTNEHVQQGKVLVSYNYKRFYAAPIDLNKNSSTYLDYLYPETTYIYHYPTTKGNGVVWPVTITSGNNYLTFRLSRWGTNYTWRLNTSTAVASEDNGDPGVIINNFEVKNYTIEQMVQALNEIREQKIAEETNSELQYLTIGTAGDQLLFTYNRSGSSDQVFVIKDSAGPVLFGQGDPEDFTAIGYDPNSGIADYPLPLPFIEEVKVSGTATTSYSELVVENHIPTIEYDARNKQCLVEAQNKTKISHKDITPLITPVSDHYTLQLTNNGIRPKTVMISYRTRDGNTLYMRDYYGDGRLFVKSKIRNSNDTTNFVYTPTPNASSYGYGYIDYSTGFIDNLTLPYLGTTKIIAKGTTYPKRFYINNKLYLLVNGVAKEYLILTGLYSVTQLVEYFKTQLTIQADGLTVGSINNQLYIENYYAGTDVDEALRNPNPGPDKTLALNISTTEAGNANFALFGTNPLTIASPKIYVDYVFSANSEDPSKFIWYQTSKFNVNVKLNEKQYFTSAHLRYIKEKMDIIRPGNAVLNKVILTKENMTEKIKIIDSFNISTGSI